MGRSHRHRKKKKGSAALRFMEYAAGGKRERPRPRRRRSDVRLNNGSRRTSGRRNKSSSEDDSSNSESGEHSSEDDRCHSHDGSYRRYESFPPVQYRAVPIQEPVFSVQPPAAPMHMQQQRPPSLPPPPYQRMAPADHTMLTIPTVSRQSQRVSECTPAHPHPHQAQVNSTPLPQTTVRRHSEPSRQHRRSGSRPSRHREQASHESGPRARLHFTLPPRTFSLPQQQRRDPSPARHRARESQGGRQREEREQRHEQDGPRTGRDSRRQKGIQDQEEALRMRKEKKREEERQKRRQEKKRQKEEEERKERERKNRRDVGVLEFLRGRNGRPAQTEATPSSRPHRASKPGGKTPSTGAERRQTTSSPVKAQGAMVNPPVANSRTTQGTQWFPNLAQMTRKLLRPRRRSSSQAEDVAQVEAPADAASSHRTQWPSVNEQTPATGTGPARPNPRGLRHRQARPNSYQASSGYMTYTDHPFSYASIIEEEEEEEEAEGEADEPEPDIGHTSQTDAISAWARSVAQDSEGAATGLETVMPDDSISRRGL
jgi:hypothetical protein